MRSRSRHSRLDVVSERGNRTRKTKRYAAIFSLIAAVAFFWRLPVTCDTTGLDVTFYAVHNKDLKNARLAGTSELVTGHFCTYGRKEGRVRHAPVLSSPRNRSAGSKVVIVSHPWGGGTEKFVSDASTELSSKIDLQLVQCDVCTQCGEQVQFACGVNGEAFKFLQSSQQMKKFFDALQADVYFLNFLFPHEAFVHYFASTNKPVVYTAHDHQTIRYSDAHEMHLSCADDSPTARSRINEDYSATKRMFLEIMRRSVILTTPSLQNVKLFGTYYPQLTFQASQPRPQWNPIEPRGFAYQNGELRILSIALSNSKGADTFKKVSSMATHKELPFTFFMLGKHSLSGAKTQHFTDMGRFYDNGDALQKIQNSKINLIWFPARRHESYCYALDLALATGLPIIATRTGSFSERLCHRDKTWLVDSCLDETEWVEVFTQLWKSPNLLHVYEQRDCANISYAPRVTDQILALKTLKVQAIDVNTAAQFVALNPKYILEGYVRSLKDIQKVLASDSHKHDVINSSSVDVEFVLDRHPGINIQRDLNEVTKRNRLSEVSATSLMLVWGYLSHFRVRNPTFTHNNRNAAVIVEPRSSQELPYVCYNIMHFLGGEWNLHIFCSGCSQYESYFDSGSVEFHEIAHRPEVAKVDKNSEFFMSPSFWRGFREENILVFQVDSFMLKSDMDIFLKSDLAFTGAFSAGIGQDITTPRGKGVNGGFSLRRRDAMIHALEAVSTEDVQKYRKESGLQPIKFGKVMPEDIYFYHALEILGYELPSADVQKKFAVQEFFSPDPMAVHGFDKGWYLTTAQLKYLIDAYVLDHGLIDPLSKMIEQLQL